MNAKEENLKRTAAAESEGEKARGETRIKAFFTEAFFGLMYALWGYLSGGALLPFGARPLGFALLAGTDRRALYVYGGLCLSAWRSTDRWMLMGIYTAILLIRVFARVVLDPPRRTEGETVKKERSFRRVLPVLFSEHTGLRMATAALGAFALGLSRLIGGGFLYYDLYGTLLSTLTAPVVVLLFTGFFTREKVTRWRRTAGFLALAFALVFAAGDLKFYGISLGAFGCLFVTLYVTRKQGIVTGMIAGTVCGLALSPDLAPLFAFAALTAGLLFSVSPSFAVSAACTVGLGWGIYVRGLGILNGLLPAILAAGTLFVVLDKLFFSAGKKEKEQEKTAAEEAVSEKAETVCAPLAAEALDSVRLADTNRRIKELCGGFSDLSRIFYSLSRQMQTPTAADLRQICDNAFDSSCTGCPQRGECWGEGYHQTSAEVGRLSGVLHRNGRVEREDAGQSLSDRCERLPDILEEINYHTALHRKQIHEGDRTEVFAMDYEALSTLLACSMTEQSGAYEPDAELSRRLCDALTGKGLGVTGATVFGGRRRRVTVRAAEYAILAREKETLTEIVKGICPFPVEEGTLEEGETELNFAEAPELSVRCAQRNRCAEGEEKYCGDTAGIFRHVDGRLFAFISDGMGAGREAALTSGISGMFLRKLLGAGCPCETVLQMLNGFLRNRGSGSLHECSATVDLMELDLMGGHASFYKSGAAPTYVFRNGSLFKLRSHTVPVGIIRELDTRKLGFDVSAGDLIVMVSDGVTQSREECPWLFDLLRSQGESASPERLADLIVKYAKAEGGCDDISALVVKLEKTPGGE